jgi:hypothetical protein
MQPWTHDERNDFIKRAVTSADPRGAKGNYYFNVMPKTGGVSDSDEESMKRSKVTEALANAIYASGDEFRNLSLKIYEILTLKLNTSQALSRFDVSNIMIVVKGSNAYAMLMSMYPNDEVARTFPWSDLDLMVLINPFVPDEYFKRLRSIVHTIVVQSISQFKRTLDHMLFLDRPINDAFLSKEAIERFKTLLADELAKLDTEEEKFVSPCFSDVVRNACSRNSFIIVDSQASEKSVVRVDVPHFERCECIPLRKSPLFCSYNDTLEFNRVSNDSEEEIIAKFSLYRVKLNVVHIHENADSPSEMKEERIGADFIDITIPSKTDSELLDFWTHARCVMIFEKSINTWVCVPDIYSCINDLHKMLFVYQCPASKRDKRQTKYDFMKKLVGPFAA